MAKLHIESILDDTTYLSVLRQAILVGMIHDLLVSLSGWCVHLWSCEDPWWCDCYAGPPLLPLIRSSVPLDIYISSPLRLLQQVPHKEIYFSYNIINASTEVTTQFKDFMELYNLLHFDDYID